MVSGCPRVFYARTVPAPVGASSITAGQKVGQNQRWRFGPGAGEDAGERRGPWTRDEAGRRRRADADFLDYLCFLL
jgi:hypothetical protein